MAKNNQIKYCTLSDLLSKNTLEEIKEKHQTGKITANLNITYKLRVSALDILKFKYLVDSQLIPPILYGIYIPIEMMNNYNEYKEQFQLLITDYFKYLYLYDIISILCRDASLIDLISYGNKLSFTNMVLDRIRRCAKYNSIFYYHTFRLFKIDHPYVKYIESCLQCIIKDKPYIYLSYEDFFNPDKSENSRLIVETLNKYCKPNKHPVIITPSTTINHKTVCNLFDVLDYVIEKDIKIDVIYMFDSFNNIEYDKRFNDEFDNKYTPYFNRLLSHLIKKDKLSYMSNSLKSYYLKINEDKITDKKFKDNLKIFKLTSLI